MATWRDVRVQHAHQVQRLHHVGAVLAGEREVGLEVVARRRAPRIWRERPRRDAVDGWPPTCSSASTSEVNSWPSGMPAKRDRDVGADARRWRTTGGARRRRRGGRMTWSDSAAISSSSPASSADLAPSSSDATSSIGWRELRRGAVVSCCGECGVEHGGRPSGGMWPGVRWNVLRGVGTTRQVGCRSRSCTPTCERCVSAIGSDLADEVERRGRVSSPSSHLAGQTSPGWVRTYWAALTLRSSSTALRPMPSAVTSSELDHAVGVDQERAAVGEALAFAHHAEVAGDLRRSGRRASGTRSCRSCRRCRATPCG